MLGSTLLTTALFALAPRGDGTPSAPPTASVSSPSPSCTDSATLSACTTQLDTCEAEREGLNGRVGELKSNLAALRSQKEQVDDALGALRGIVREHLGATTPDGVKAKLKSMSDERDDAQLEASKASKNLEKALSARHTATRRLEQARQAVVRIEGRLVGADPNGEERRHLQKQLETAKSAVLDWESKNIQTADHLEQARRTEADSQRVLQQKLHSQRREHARELDSLARRVDGGRRLRRMQNTIDTALVISIAMIALVGCWIVLRRGLRTSSYADTKREELMEAVAERHGSAWAPSPVELAAMDGWARSVVLADAARDAVEKLVRASAAGAAGVVLIALGYVTLHGGTPEAIGTLVETKLWKIIVGFFGPPAAAITAWTAVQQRVRDFSDLCKQLGLLDPLQGDADAPTQRPR